MLLLRSLLHTLWMLIAVIPVAIWMVAAAPFAGSRRMFGYAKWFLALAIGGLRVLCGVRWRVSGLEHLPQGETSPAILLSKHQSTLETFLLPLVMPHDLAFVFKKELLYIPFFGWGIARVDMIHIDRSKRAEAFAKVVEQGRRLLAKGTWVIMFPEGTRIPRGQAGQYKLGGARLAVATGAPVVPIAVATARCWPKNSWRKYPGTAEIVIGKPIASAGRTPEDLMAEVEQWIETEMRRIDPEAYAGEARAAAQPAAAAR
jgi:1-acyl-sn-glycerol-3-phosphate acyltransferase